jgi:hypothetical protein
MNYYGSMEQYWNIGPTENTIPVIRNIGPTENTIPVILEYWAHREYNSCDTGIWGPQEIEFQ